MTGTEFDYRDFATLVQVFSIAMGVIGYFFKPWQILKTFLGFDEQQRRAFIGAPLDYAYRPFKLPYFLIQVLDVVIFVLSLAYAIIMAIALISLVDVPLFGGGFYLSVKTPLMFSFFLFPILYLIPMVLIIIITTILNRMIRGTRHYRTT